MRENGILLWGIVEGLKRMTQVGVSTLDLDEYAESEIRKAGAVPAFKGYRGYKATLCASVNHEVVHGIPSSRRKLKEGDIISLDLGLKRQGLYSDMAVTVPVGKVSQEIVEFLRISEEALWKGIAKVIPGNRVGDISHAVQSHVERNGFSVVREYVGHGVGRSLHEEPVIPNFGPPRVGPRLEFGMVLAIEPMVNVGGFEVEVLDDGWTVVTADKKLSAHFEHSVAVSEDGPVVLTLPPEMVAPQRENG